MEVMNHDDIVQGHEKGQYHDGSARLSKPAQDILIQHDTMQQHAWFVSLSEMQQKILSNLTFASYVSRRASPRGSAPYTVYHYTMTLPSMKWAVDRRYSECYRLKEVLLRQLRRCRQNQHPMARILCPVAQLDFPKKHIFADSRSKEIIYERKHKLKSFFQCCFEIRSYLYIYTVVYEKNPHLSLQSCSVDLIELLDRFLATPAQLKEDQRCKATCILGILQQDDQRHSMLRKDERRPHTFLNEDGDCSICLCELEDDETSHASRMDNQSVITLPCTHAFHRECVLPWLVRDHTCPLCRESAVDASSKGHMKAHEDDK
jgi:hypothetical protein